MSGGQTRSFTYDAAGNVTYDARSGVGYGYTYNAANRMESFSINGVVQAEYTYNARGQQVIRRLTQTGQTIHSIYDTFGNRIAEYEYDDVSGSSTLLREYVWMDGQAVAVIEGGEVYYVRSDHIGRPVFATDDTGTIVWEAEYLPFGGVHTSTGTNIALRFPGQWFQSESGLHQNWMRDYDPTTGRYIQADPLGLVDGASVYGYARQNPGRYIDPRGEHSQSALCVVRRVAGYPVGPECSPHTPPYGQPHTATCGNGEPLDPFDLLPPVVQNQEGDGEDKETERNPKQDKPLSKDDIEKLKDRGVDPHDLKDGFGPPSRSDLYKDRKGNVYVKPKGGRGNGDPTGININDF